MKRPLVLLLALVSCGVASDSALSLLGGGCLIDSDCSGELVCVYERCHEACDATRDCPDGRCVRGQNGVHICQPREDVSCSLNSDCPEPLICAVDNQCRNPCLTTSDCVGTQVCAGFVCAEPEELVDGELPRAPGQGEGEGKPCAVNSDCDGDLLCIEQRCLYECVVNEDCASRVCENGHCNPPEPVCVPGKQRACGDPGCVEVCIASASGPAYGQCECEPTTSGPGGAGGAGVGGDLVAGMGGGGFGNMGGGGESVGGSGGYGGMGGGGSGMGVVGGGGFGGMGVGGSGMGVVGGGGFGGVAGGGSGMGLVGGGGCGGMGMGGVLSNCASL